MIKKKKNVRLPWDQTEGTPDPGCGMREGGKVQTET